MRLVWPLLLALCACKSEGGDDRPINPGGDDVIGSNSMHDAGPGDGVVNDGPMITGRVCVLPDVRVPANCAPTGAGGVTVTIGSSSAVSSDDGTFTIPTPSGAGLVWMLGGSVDLVPSVVPFTTSNVLPMISVDQYATITGANGVVLGVGEGSVFLYVVQGGTPLAGASGTNSAGGRDFASTGSLATWAEDGLTDTHGVLWFPNLILAAGEPSFAVQPPVGDPATTTLPVVDGAITFAALDVPVQL